MSRTWTSLCNKGTCPPESSKARGLATAAGTVLAAEYVQSQISYFPGEDIEDNTVTSVQQCEVLARKRGEMQIGKMEKENNSKDSVPSRA